MVQSKEMYYGEFKAFYALFSWHNVEMEEAL